MDDDIDDLKEKIDELESDNEDLRSNVEDLRNEIYDTKVELNEFKKELSDLWQNCKSKGYESHFWNDLVKKLDGLCYEWEVYIE